MAAASSADPAILQATTPLPLSAADKANPSSSVGTASPKKAWKQRSSASNGPPAPAVAATVEPGPVIGGPESWPALSESASKMPVKPSAKASDASSGSPSPPTHQRQMVLSPSKSTSSNPSISPGPNRVAQPHPKPRKNNAPNLANGIGAPNLANGIGGPMHPPFSDSPAGSPHTNPVSGASWRGDSSSSISASSTTTSNNFDSHNTNHRRVGHAGNKWRGNGGGSYNNGGRRNQEYFDGNHRGQPRGMRSQYTRGHPPPPPFVATSPQPRSPYVGPMPFSDMSGQMYYYSVPPPPEMMRGMAFVPHPVASPSAFMLPPPMEPQRSMLLKQIEYYFSPENLCKDTFLRKNMDGEGWVQISVIAGFNKVKDITNNLQFIVETLQLSTVIEVQGGRVRRREDWKKWLLPPEQQESTGNFSSQGSSSQITNSSLSSHFQRLGLESGNGHLDLPLQGEASLSRSSTSGDMSEHIQLTGLHVNAEPGQVMGPVDVGRVLVMGNTF